LQVKSLTRFLCFVTRPILGSLLFCGFVAISSANGLDPNVSLEIPPAGALAKDLGINEKELKGRVEDFATALSQGKKSQALSRICAKDEETCHLIRDFHDQAPEAKRDRQKARRGIGGPIRVTEKNVKETQRLPFQNVMSRVRPKDEFQLFEVAQLSLKTPDCPRNLSAALALKVEEYFPFEKARTLSKDLFEHARHCLSQADPAYERLYLRQGLYALYQGNKARAKELLLQARKTKRSSEGYRALYWLGKLDQKEGSAEKNNEYWTELMAQYPLSFYAISAAASLKMDPMEMITQRKLGGLQRVVADDPDLNRMIRWLEVLYSFQKNSAVAKWASWIVRSNEQELGMDVLNYISTIKVAAGKHRSNISMLFGYFRRNPQTLNQEALKLLYPRPYFDIVQAEAKGRVDLFLVMGLMRQESAFDPRAVSTAKAKGLMQIIPQTARTLASQGHKKLLNEKENTKMGVKYLVQLNNRFDGSAELVLAAYNAGPHRVDQWLKRNPTRSDNPLLWNDLIPFAETRDYVVSILRNNYLYARLYGSLEDNELSLHSKIVKDLLALAKAEK